MKKWKGLWAGLCAAAILFSATACSGDTTWAMKTDKVTVPAGVYISYLQDAYDEAKNKIGEVDDFWAESIDGFSAEQWIVNEGVARTKQHIAAEYLFDELGMELGVEGENTIKTRTDSYWLENKEDCEKHGVSSASVRKLSENSYKTGKVFEYYYGEGGEEEVPEDELKDYYYETYAKVKYLSVSRYDLQTGEKIADDEITKKLDGYVTRMNRGEEIDEIIDEYMAELWVAYGITEPYEPDTSDENRNVTVIGKNQEGNIKGFTEKTFAQTEFNVPYTDESDGFYAYFGARYDLKEDPELFENSRSSLLYEVRRDAFLEKLGEKIASLEPITLNTDAISRYSPKMFD